MDVTTLSVEYGSKGNEQRLGRKSETNEKDQLGLSLARAHCVGSRDLPIRLSLMQMIVSTGQRCLAQFVSEPCLPQEFPCFLCMRLESPAMLLPLGEFGLGSLSML